MTSYFPIGAFTPEAATVPSDPPSLDGFCSDVVSFLTLFALTIAKVTAPAAIKSDAIVIPASIMNFLSLALFGVLSMTGDSFHRPRLSGRCSYWCWLYWSRLKFCTATSAKNCIICDNAITFCTFLHIYSPFLFKKYLN